MNLVLLDFVFIGLLGIFFLMSYFRGTLRELISLAGIAGGYLAAHWYHVGLADLLSPVLRNVRVAEAVAFIAIMALGYMIGTFASGIGDYYNSSSRSFGSRALAGVIGLAKGLAIALALVWLIDTHFPPLQRELAQSTVAAALHRMIEVLQGWNLL